MCFKKFKGAFIRFVECIQEGIDHQMSDEMKIKKDSKLEALAMAEESSVDFSDNLGSILQAENLSDQRAERDCSSVSDDFEAMELAQADYSSFSDDSMAADLEQPKESDEDGTRHDELSEISSFDDFSNAEQETQPEKSWDVGVTEQQIKESEPKALVDYSDSDSCDSIDDQSVAARTKASGKVIKCRVCESTFSVEQHLRRHLVGTHLKLSRMACELCLEIFSGKESFRQHSALKHGIVLQKDTRRQLPNFCNHCGKVFASSLILTEHYYSIMKAGK